jgi:hypothetical protein
MGCKAGACYDSEPAEEAMDRRVRFAVFILLLAGTAGACRSQEAQDRKCVVDPDTPEPPKCAFENRNGELYLSQKYVALYFKKSHARLAPIFLTNDSWAYMNRQGRVVVKNVAPYDNWAGEFHHGLVRVTRGDKWGLANQDGVLVVPFSYDGMGEYEPGKGWWACKGCRRVYDSYHEHSWFEGGEEFWLDSLGHVSNAVKKPEAKH